MHGLLLLCLAIGLAGAKIAEKSYRPAREYVYLYNTQVVSGLPGLSNIYSALRVHAYVRAQFVTASRVKAVMENIQLFKFNDAIENMVPTNIQLPLTLLTPVTGPQATNIIAELSKPIMFNYQAGHVTKFQTESSDPHWSVNIKRGLVSLFEVNLEQRYSLEINRTTTVDFSKNPATYRCMEPSPLGFVETAYTVVPLSPISKKVVKVRNYMNLMDNYYWHKSTISAMRSTAETEHSMQAPISADGQVVYTVAGDKTKLLIISAIAESKYTMWTYARKNNYKVQTVVNQTLTIIDAVDLKAGTPIPEVASPIVRTLKTFVPEMEMDPMGAFSNLTETSQSLAGHVTYPKEAVVFILQKAAAYIGDTVSPDATMFVIGAVDAIRNCDPTVIEELVKTYITPTKPTEMVAKNIRAVLIKVLPTVATPAIAKIIIENIALFPPSRAPYVIGHLVLAAEPNVHVMKMLMELATTSATTSPKLRRATLLAIGALTHKLRVSRYRTLYYIERSWNYTRIMLSLEKNSMVQAELTAMKQSLEDRISQTATLTTTLIQGVVTLFRNMLTKAAADPEEMILALKAIGNAGVAPMMEDVRAVLINPSIPAGIRVQAAFALRRVAPYNVEAATHILMPLINNLYVASPVRMACFDVLVLANPAAAVLIEVAQSIRYDVDLQFATYVGSVLMRLSNSTNPMLAPLANKAARALAMTVPPMPGYQYSRNVAYGKYVYSRGRPIYGGDVTAAYYSTNNSMIPEAAAAQINFYAFERFGELFEMGYNTEGLQSLLDKFVGPRGVLSNRKSLFDLLSRSARSVGSNARIEEIFKTLGVVARGGQPFHGHIYYKLNGHELMYYPISTIVQKAISSGKFASSLSVSALKTGLPFDIRRSYILADSRMIVPTECGLPLQLELTASNALVATGTAQCSVSPALMESKRQGKPPMNLAAKLDMKLSNGFEAIIRMSIDGFVAESGVAVKATTRTNLPFAASLTVDLENHKIFTDITPPASKTEPIVAMETYPFTFVNFGSPSPNTIPPSHDVRAIHATVNSVVTPVYRNYTSGRVGVQLGLIGFIASNGYSATKKIPCPVFGVSSLGWWSIPLVAPVQPLHVEVAFTSEGRVPGPVAKSSSCSSFLSKVTMCLWDDSEPSVAEDSSADSSAPLAEAIPDFASLKSKVISVAALRSKLQSKLKDSVSLMANGTKWAMVATVKAGATPVAHAEAMWIRANEGFTHQFAARIARPDVPKFNAKAAEITVHSELQFPSGLVLPESLFDPAYLAAWNRQLHNILGYKINHALFKSLSTSALTRAQQAHIPVTEDPVILIERLVTSIAAASKTPELNAWEPILKQLIANANFVKDIKGRAYSPYAFFVTESILKSVFTNVESLCTGLGAEISRLAQSKAANPVETTIVHYVLLKQKMLISDVVLLAAKLSKYAAFSSGEMMWTRAKALWSSYKQNAIAYMTVMSQISSLPPSAEIAPGLTELMTVSKIQATTLKALLSNEGAAETADVSPLLQATMQAIHAIANVEMPSKAPNPQVVNLITQVAIKHQMIKLSFLQPLRYRQTLTQTPPQQLAKFANIVKTVDMYTRIICYRAAQWVTIYNDQHYFLPSLSPNDKSIATMVTKASTMMYSFAVSMLTAAPTASVPTPAAPSAILPTMTNIAQELVTLSDAILLAPAPPSPYIILRSLTTVLEFKSMIIWFKEVMMYAPGNTTSVASANAIFNQMNLLVPKIASTFELFAAVAPPQAEEQHVFMSSTPVRSVDVVLHELMQTESSLAAQISSMTSVPKAQIKQICSHVVSSVETVLSRMASVLDSGALFENPSVARHSPQLFDHLLSTLLATMHMAKSQAAQMAAPQPALASIDSYISKLVAMQARYVTESAQHHIPPVVGSYSGSGPVPQIQKLMAVVTSLKSQVSTTSSFPKSLMTTIATKLQEVITEATSIINAGSIWINPAVQSQAQPMFGTLLSECEAMLGICLSKAASAPPACIAKIRSFLTTVTALKARFAAEAAKHGTPPVQSGSPIFSELTKLKTVLYMVATKVKAIPTLTSKTELRTTCTYLQYATTHFLTEMNRIVTSEAMWANTPNRLPTTRFFKTLCTRFEEILTEVTTEATNFKWRVPAEVTTMVTAMKTKITTIIATYTAEAKKHGIPPMVSVSSNPVPQIQKLMAIVTPLKNQVSAASSFPKSLMEMVSNKLQEVIAEATSILNAGSIWVNPAVQSHAQSMFETVLAECEAILGICLSKAGAASAPPACIANIRSILTTVTTMKSRFETEAAKHGTPPMIFASSNPIPQIQKLMAIVTSLKNQVNTASSFPKSLMEMISNKLQEVTAEATSILNAGSIWVNPAWQSQAQSMFGTVIAECEAILGICLSKAGAASAPPACIANIRSMLTTVTTMKSRFETEAAKHSTPPMVFASSNPLPQIQKLMAIATSLKNQISAASSFPKSIMDTVSSKLQEVIAEATSILNAGSIWVNPAVQSRAQSMFGTVLAECEAILGICLSKAGAASAPPACIANIRSILAAVTTLKTRFETEAARHGIPPVQSGSPIFTELTQLKTVLHMVDTKVKAIPTLTSKTELRTTCTYLQSATTHFLTEMNRIVTSPALWAATSDRLTTTRFFKTLCTRFEEILTEVTTEATNFKWPVPSEVTTMVTAMKTKITTIIATYTAEAKKHGIPPMVSASSNPIPQIQKLMAVATSLKNQVNTASSFPKSIMETVSSKLQEVIAEATSILNAGSIWVNPAVQSQAQSMFGTVLAECEAILGICLSKAGAASAPPACIANIRSILAAVTTLKTRFVTESAKHGVPASSPSAPGPYTPSKYPTGIVGFINIAYGHPSPSPLISIKVFGSKSFEQIINEIAQVNPFRRDPTFQAALMYGSGPFHIANVNDYWMKELNEYRHIHLVASIPNAAAIPMKCRRMVYKVKDVFNRMFSPYRRTAPTPINTVPANTVSALFVYRAYKTKLMDMYLTSARKTVTITGMGACPVVRAVLPMSSAPKRVQIAGYLSYGNLPATCKWSGPMVKTFDKVFVLMPNIGTCPAVLAMDCSATKSFAVLAKPVDTTSMGLPAAYANASKILQIFGAGHVIEIIPSPAGVATVKIDGTPKPVEVGSPIVIEKTLHYGRPAAAVIIKKLIIAGRPVIKAELPIVGISVLTNCFYVEVVPSMMFKGKTCGLCSNFDGQLNREFVGPSGKLFYAPEPFARSYVVSDGQCSAPTPAIPTPPVPVAPITAEPAVKASPCAPRQVTVVKSRSKGKRACFSLQPVAQCPAGCKAKKQERKPIPFNCMDASSAEAQKLIGESQRRVLSELKGRPATFSIGLKHAKVCAPVA